MLVFLLTLVWGWRMVMLQLSGFYCNSLNKEMVGPSRIAMFRSEVWALVSKWFVMDAGCLQ